MRIAHSIASDFDTVNTPRTKHIALQVLHKIAFCLYVCFFTFGRPAFFLAYNWHSIILPPCVSIPPYKPFCIMRSFSLNDKSSHLPFGVLPVGNSFQVYTYLVLPNASTYCKCICRLVFDFLLSVIFCFCYLIFLMLTSFKI